MSYSRRALWKSSRAALALWLALSSTAPALDLKEALGPSGSLRLGAFESDRRYTSGSPVSEGSAWLTLRPQSVWDTKFFFEGYLYGENVERTFEGKAEAREAYAERALGPFDLRVGRQLIVWGRADKVNPTDTLTVRDQRVLFTDDEEQRLGQFATQLTWNVTDSIRLIGVWQPEWRRPRFAFPPVPGVSIVQRDPDDPARDFALKLDGTLGGIDASLSYYNGYDRLPDLALDSAGPSGILVGLYHNPIQVYGADFATAVGSYGLRAEVAYTSTRDKSGADPLIKNPLLAGVFGVERSFFENFNLNVQYLFRHTIDFVPLDGISDPNTRALATQGYFVANQTRPWLHGVSVRASLKAWHETFESEVAVVGWVERGDFLIRPKVTYALTDSLKGIVGAEWFTGPTGSFFGTLRPLSTAFAEIRWSY